MNPTARSRNTRLRAVVAALTVTAGVIAGVAGGTSPAVAVEVPQTLADARPASTGVVEPGFAVDFVAATWTGGHDAGAGASVRFRHGNDWSDWRPMGEDGAQAEGSFGTALVAAGDADAYQLRNVPASARVSAINTTDGPREVVGRVRRGAAGAFAACRSRADWGADESLMTWSPVFQPVQVLTIHHTDTASDDTDPAATMRAMYRYHAVDRGWGDIGYQLVVDQQGTVFEGRSSGTRSRSCLTEGGDGTDFGDTEDGTGRGVVGAHVDQWNSANLGVALLGTYTSVAPPAAQRSSLDDVLATLARRHGIDPTLTSYPFTNPANGAQKTVPTISGHRDWLATECPGGTLYAALADIRVSVAARLASPAATTPTTSTTSTTSTTTAPAAKGKPTKPRR